MRVAFVALETHLHRESDANERLRTILELLDEHGHTVEVLTASFWDGDSRTFERDGIVYHGIVESTDATRGFFLRVPTALRSIEHDVIHTTPYPASQVIAASLGSKLTRTPVVLELYGSDRHRTDRWEDLAMGRPERIITPSRMVETWVREHEVEADRIKVVPNPIDLDLIEDVSPNDDIGDIVNARHLDEDANLESFLLGLAELRDREWRAHVFGDGSHRPMYESLARDLRIDDRVIFEGEVSLEDRIAAYRSAHVFVQTATDCVFPTELLWAMAAGCVGIVEYHVDSAAHELVEGRKRGFRTTSEQELADAILTAGSLDRLDIDDQFDQFDRRPISNRYIDIYKELR